jgi:hypothetical protein
MNKSFTLCLLALAVSATTVFGQQSSQPVPTPSRVTVTNTIPPSQSWTTPVPASTATPFPKPVKPAVVVGTETFPSQASNLNYKGLSFSAIKQKLAEAKRQMMSKPITTVLATPVQPNSSFPASAPMNNGFPAPVVPAPSLVRIAYYDWRTRSVEYITVTKDAFLTANSITAAISSNGKTVTTRTIRANGVNTPIEILDNGQQQLPLMIQYPVEKNGRFIETAYYMSTHPGIITPEVVSAGRFYVKNTVDIAREKLQAKGYFIQPKVADIAERLATVEHVDHTRFRTEFQPNIFNDIFTLYALNEGQTFRYSVSSAGAGGMVQMIPSTYSMVRSRYPNAALMPDFVEGMRNHVNATQAMLLYMQMTWNDLNASPTVANALQTGLATPEQLMAAGYNSNPAKLARYIDRGGLGWTSLIPRETQMYLQIFSSLERNVTLVPRKQ